MDRHPASSQLAPSPFQSPDAAAGMAVTGRPPDPPDPPDPANTIQSPAPSGGMAVAGAGVPEPLEVRPPDPRTDLASLTDFDHSLAAATARPKTVIVNCD